MCATDRRRCFSCYEHWLRGKRGKSCEWRVCRCHRRASRSSSSIACKSAARLVRSCLRRVLSISGRGSGSRGRELSLQLLLLLVSVACFGNSLTGDFVHDDLSAICANPDVMGKSGLLQVFANDFWGKPMSDPDSHKSYRPLTTLSFR